MMHPYHEADAFINMGSKTTRLWWEERENRRVLGVKKVAEKNAENQIENEEMGGQCLQGSWLMARHSRFEHIFPLLITLQMSLANHGFATTHH